METKEKNPANITNVTDIKDTYNDGDSIFDKMKAFGDIKTYLGTIISSLKDYGTILSKRAELLANNFTSIIIMLYDKLE